MDDLTTESLFNGRITIRQPASGYRYAIDAVILAHAAALKPGARACDIGTGCGIIPLVMAYRDPAIKEIIGIEIQPRLAGIAGSNVLRNRMESRIRIICHDAKNLTPEDTKGKFDRIVCNPPHQPQNAARVNPAMEKALARHEIALTLEDLLSAAGRLLVPDGGLMMIYPASRIADVLYRMRERGIAPKALRFVHTAMGKDAKRVIVEGVLGGGPGTTVTSPLFLTDDKGRNTPELDAMFSE